MRLPIVAAALALIVGQALPAQRADHQRAAFGRTSIEYQRPTAPVTGQVRAPHRHSTKTLIVAGLIGGAVGAFSGAVVGMSAENCGSRPDDDMCGIVGGALGFLIGEAIGVPVGINWVTKSRGTLSRSIPTSLGVTVGSLVIPGAFVLAIPAQLWTTIRIERKAS